jgi:hypothetical protein
MATVEKHLLVLLTQLLAACQSLKIPRLFGFKYEARTIDELRIDRPYLDGVEFKLCKYFTAVYIIFINNS